MDWYEYPRGAPCKPSGVAPLPNALERTQAQLIELYSNFREYVWILVPTNNCGS